MLSIVATPIGNLGDVTLRALETLRTCDAIACEDSRVTGLLLQHLGLPKKPLLPLQGSGGPRRIEQALAMLSSGKHLALVCDAGTPGISDPAYALVERAREAGVQITPVPGPSAFLAALSASGLPMHRFVFLGFLPQKKGRKSLLSSFENEDRTIVFYESVHRIERTLRELAEALAAQSDRPVVLARELTKLHEEIVRTTVAALPSLAHRITKKGEFTIVVGPPWTGAAPDRDVD